MGVVVVSGSAHCPNLANFSFFNSLLKVGRAATDFACMMAPWLAVRSSERGKDGRKNKKEVAVGWGEKKREYSGSVALCGDEGSYLGAKQVLYSEVCTTHAGLLITAVTSSMCRSAFHSG